MIKVKVPSMFMSQIEIHRMSKGSYVDGEWVEGRRNKNYIMASIQPVPSSNYKLLPEGDKPEKYIQLYTNEVLLMPDKNEKPDEILYNNLVYIMINLDNWKENGYTSALFREA